MATTCANGINKWLNYEIPCKTLALVGYARKQSEAHSLAEPQHIQPHRAGYRVFTQFILPFCVSGSKAYFDICTETCPNNNSNSNYSNSSSTHAKLSSCQGVAGEQGQGGRTTGAGSRTARKFFIVNRHKEGKKKPTKLATQPSG